MCSKVIDACLAYTAMLKSKISQYHDWHHYTNTRHRRNAYSAVVQTKN